MTPSNTPPRRSGSAIVGSPFSIDFDLRSDELRVLSDTVQNLRIDPDTGALITDDTGASASLFGFVDANLIDIKFVR